MSKRGQNEGSVYLLRPGKWAAAVSMEGGKRRVVFADTRKEAAAKLLELLRQRKELTLKPPERLTVASYLEHWLGSARPTVRHSTYVSYRVITSSHIVPTLGRIQLVRLRPEDVQRLLNQKLESGLSPRRVQLIHAVLRRALNRAVKLDMVPRNVALLVDVPRVSYQEVEPLAPSEVRRLLEHAAADRLEALYTVALALGLRQGELLGLQWSDVDFDRMEIHVRAALQRIDGALRLVETKTRRSRRTLAMSDFVAGVLKQHRARQFEERLLLGAEWPETGFVFTSSSGHPLDGRNVTRGFQRMLKRAGITKRRFHDLRHSCASLFLAQGVSPRVVMEILGHSQIALTMNTYTHVISDLQRQAAERMEGVLTAPS